MSSFRLNSGHSDFKAAVAQSTPATITLDSGIQVDDFMLVIAEFFTWAPDGFTNLTCTAASGHTWTQVGTMQSSPVAGGLVAHSVLYKRVATSGDAGDTLTFAAVGTPGPTNQMWWSISTGAWVGFPGGIDVFSVANGAPASAQTDFTFPSATTTQDGDWGLYIGFGADNGSGDITDASPAGTSRRTKMWNSGLISVINDSNGSVGSAGTTIGPSAHAILTGGGSSPSAWYSMWTVALSPTSAGVTGTGSIRMHKMGISIQGRLPGVGSIHMHKMQISGTGNAPLRGTGSIRMHKMGISASGSVADLNVVFVNTTSGVDNYTVTSSMNGPGTTTLRVLRPTSPAAGYSPAFIYTLPVEAQGGTTFGNGLDHINSLDAHNAYNLTVVEPSFKIDPWFADSDIDANRHYQSFMVALRKWTQANLGATGFEQHILIGFSKSGIGGQNLILNNPTIWDKCISWDFPTDGDIWSRFSGSSDLNYGTDANFLAHYQLDNTALAAKKGPFLTKNRLYIADGTSFDTDVSNYDGRLTSNGLLHTYPTPVTRTHSWDSGWVGPALADVMVLQTSGTGSIRMKKMKLTSSGQIKISGAGSIRMKKMGMAGAGKVKISGTGSIRMKKMKIVTPEFFHAHASNMFVFTDV